MTKSQVFSERRTFIEGYLFTCLKTMPNFETIKYVKDAKTDAEYIRITDYLGGKVYLDITGESDAEIFMDVARIVISSEDDKVSLPKSVVVEIEKMRAISFLFRNGGVNNG